MLHLLKTTTFSSAVHRSSDIIKNIATISETSDTKLLDALYDENTEGKHDVSQKYSKWLWRKKSHLTWIIIIKLPVIQIQFCAYSDRILGINQGLFCLRAFSNFKISVE